MEIVNRKCGRKEVECPALMSFSTPGCPEVFHHSQLSFMLTLAFSMNSDSGDSYPESRGFGQG